MQQFIDCPLTFRTESPAATCKGKMLLLPAQVDPENERSAIQWKIWILSTRLASLDVQNEDEELLQSPARQLEDLINFETDVFIMGGGNAYVQGRLAMEKYFTHILFGIAPSLSLHVLRPLAWIISWSKRTRAPGITGLFDMIA